MSYQVDPLLPITQPFARPRQRFGLFSGFVLISQNRADAKRQVVADQHWQLVKEEDRQNEELLDLSYQILLTDVLGVGAARLQALEAAARRRAQCLLAGAPPSARAAVTGCTALVSSRRWS